jgi:integrase
MAYEARVAGVTSTRTLRKAMTNYRSKRGNCYYFRRKIPLELQAQFDGRREIVKALGTSDPSKADALCREYAVVYDSIFAAARQSAEASNATESVQASIDAAQKAAIAQQREDWERAQDDHNEEADSLSYQTEEQEFAEHDRQTARFEALVREEQERLRARIEAQRRLGGTHAGRTIVEAVAPNHKVAPAINPTGKTLRGVVPSWKARNAPKQNAIGRAEKAIALFEEAVGKHPLHELTKAHGATFVQFLLDSESRGFGRKTAANHAASITALLNVAVKDDLIDRNPLDLTFDWTIGAEKREPWTDGELTLMYGHALFSAQLDSVPEWQNVKPADGRALLLMLQHTGARIGEIAQLRRGDIQVRDGITVIRITADAGTVKTKESERTVPLADHLLVDPWFSAWLAEVTDGTRPNDPALPSMAGRARGPADTAVQWFRQFRADVGLPPGKLNGAHRFRHWIRSALAAKHVGVETADAITGHAAQGSSGRVDYTKIPPLVMLAALNRLTYPKVSGGNGA